MSVTLLSATYADPRNCHVSAPTMSTIGVERHSLIVEMAQLFRVVDGSITQTRAQGFCGVGAGFAQSKIARKRAIGTAHLTGWQRARGVRWRSSVAINRAGARSRVRLYTRAPSVRLSAG